MTYDAAIIGGGPAGLAAALALGRARKRVLLLDAGVRRNEAATHIYNFVTRDGTPPEEFRAIARAQLRSYPNVEVQDLRIAAIHGGKGAFSLAVEGRPEEIAARRIMLCTGMIDESLPMDGFAELWGHSIFICPYCHGWEVQDKPWGVLVRDAMTVPFALTLRGWTDRLTLFTGVPQATAGPAFELTADQGAQLEAAGIRIERAPITQLHREGNKLTSVELEGGARVTCDVLFAHPPQRHVPLIASLGLALDEQGYVKVDPMMRETSIPGIYAAGDLTTRAQGAALAAAAGTMAAGMLNHELTVALVGSAGSARSVG